MPCAAAVAARSHVQIADDDNPPRVGWRRLRRNERRSEDEHQTQHYGSLASEALMISRSFRTKMCRLAYAGCDQCTAPSSRRRAYGCVGAISWVRLISSKPSGDSLAITSSPRSLLMK